MRPSVVAALRRIAAQSTRAFSRNFPTAPRLLTGAGGGALAISLFGASKEDAKLKLPFPNYDIVIREADTLYDNYLIDNAYNILRKYENSEYPELLWRLARVLCEQGKLAKNQKEREVLMKEAFAIVQKAIACEPPEGSFGAHKWMGILLDYIGEIEGTKARIAKSYEVRKHLERALEIKDTDATTWHILGVWHFTFADMSTITRMAAKAIFGTPPSSTYEQALEHFMKAENIQPNFYSTNTLYIGEVYERLGRKEEAIEFYRRAFRMPVISADDQAAHRKAHDKLKKANVKDSELDPRAKIVEGKGV